MLNFRLLWQDLSRHRRYAIAAVMVFLIGMYAGAAYSDEFQRYLEGQLRAIRDIAGTLTRQNYPELKLFLFIFFNNAIKSLLVVLLGCLFGLFPLFFLVTNGMILGFVLASPAPGQTYAELAVGLLPHGIIEIPAILFAAAYGIRLGWISARGLATFPWEEQRKRTAEEFRSYFQVVPALTVVLIGSLLAAAVIESTLTYWLVGLMKS